MTYMVPFDGSALSAAALAKARMYSIALDEASPDIRQSIYSEGSLEVVAVSVIPDSAHYAREKDWIEDDERFNVRDVVGTLHGQVTEIDPGASFQFERVDGEARAGTISTRLRQKARALDADVIFIGSENAGRIVTPVASVSASVAADQDYDVHIVRRALPKKMRARLRSEFFVLD